MKLVSQATTYMPVFVDGEKVQERFEDGDTIELSRKEGEKWLATGNFLVVPEPVLKVPAKK